MRHHSTSALIVTCLALASCTTASENAQTNGPKGDEARLIALAQDIDRRGDKATAASLYERAASVSSDTIGAHIRLGDAQLASGQPEQAAKSFRTALAKDSNNGRALLGLGTAQLQSNEVESAARTLAARRAPPVAAPTATATFEIVEDERGGGSGKKKYLGPGLCT